MKTKIQRADAAQVALLVGANKLERARKENTPVAVCAAIEATAQEIAEAIRGDAQR